MFCYFFANNSPHTGKQGLIVLLMLYAITCHGSDDRLSILVLGDSLSAAYGIQPSQGWVSLLDKQLNQTSNDYRIINASISGETTGGGLARLPVLLKRHSPDIVIIELGANDGLRGHPIATLRNNLQQLVTQSQQAEAKVLLTGMHIPPNYGSRYTRMFHQSFAMMAKQFNVTLVPFLLEGVVGNRQLIQADGLHPTAAAQPLILQNVTPYLNKIISPSG